MPRYDWRCPDGHVHEMVSSYERRDDPRTCPTCDQPTERQFPLSHSPPSGVYSYAPNVGDPHVFEQRREAIKRMKEGGPRVIPKPLPRDYIPPHER